MREEGVGRRACYHRGADPSAQERAAANGGAYDNGPFRIVLSGVRRVAYALAANST